ncbi:MAG: hypothetical protein V4634_02005 [Pseudomonadota bacterium]
MFANAGEKSFNLLKIDVWSSYLGTASKEGYTASCYCKPAKNLKDTAQTKSPDVLLGSSGLLA